MTTVEMVTYLTCNYPGFTSIETETSGGDFWDDSLKITARRDDFTMCGIPPRGSDIRIKDWLDKFIFDFDREYRQSRPSNIYLSSRYYDGRRAGKPILDDISEYIRNDLENTERLYKEMPYYRNSGINKNSIKDVIFNDPATIVFWTDGSKTVVKCQNNDTFDPEVGLAMAIAKKALGNKGNYCNVIKKWTDKYYQKQEK